MIFTELNSGLYQIEQENERFIGFRMGPTSSQLAKTVFTKQISPGALFEAPQINPQSCSDWPIIGIANYRESIIAYGPWIDNARLGSEIVNSNDWHSLDFVYQACRV